MNGERPEPHENVDERQFADNNNQEINTCYYASERNCYGSVYYDPYSKKHLCSKCSGCDATEIDIY